MALNPVLAPFPLPLRCVLLGVQRQEGRSGVRAWVWCALAVLPRSSTRPGQLMPGECAGRGRRADSGAGRQECLLPSFRRGRRSGRCCSVALTRGPTSSVARRPTLYPPSQPPSSNRHMQPLPPVRRSATPRSAPARTYVRVSQSRLRDSPPAPLRPLSPSSGAWFLVPWSCWRKLLTVLAARQGSSDTVWQCSNSTWRPPSDT
jgi:hypothetical protein